VAASTVALLIGLALTWLLHRYEHAQVQVGPGAPAPAGGPLISIIMPARNEARNIGRSVPALLAQTYPNLEIIVVDDQSTDATPQILADLAARDPRLIVTRGAALPPGWRGKPHALAQGEALAHGEWLCFIDADTFATPELVAAAYAAAEAHAADLFTILTNQRLGSFWEKVVMPVVLSGMAFGFPPDRVNDPRRPDAVANGQFILIRRKVYEAVGGHTALRGSLVEDKALAETVKRAGYRLLLADGRELAETRMYTTLAEMWEGWTKNMYLGLQDRLWLLFLGGFVSLLGAVALPAWLLAGLVWLSRGGGAPAAVVVAEVLVLWAALLYARARVARGLGISGWYALSLPLGAGVFGAMMLTSTWRVLTGKGVAWKGRIYT
jgi:chlorobactene glucosyltransferase